MGSILLDGKDIGVLLLEKGYAKLEQYQNTQKVVPINFSLYKAAEKSARESKLGVWSPQEEQTQKKRQNIHNIENLAETHFKTPKIEKSFKGIVEFFNAGTFTIYIQELNGFIKFALSDILIHKINFKNVEELRCCVEEHALQRNVVIELLKEQSPGFFLGNLEIVNSNLDLKILLLSKGFAKLNVDSVTEIPQNRFKELKNAMEEAQNQSLRVWAEYKGSKNSKKIEGNEAVFTGKVIEIHAGDCLSIQNQLGQINRYNLANLSAPKMGNPKRAESDKPWAFESKDFLRKLAIGLH